MKDVVLLRLLVLLTFFASSLASDISFSPWQNLGLYGLYPRKWFKSFKLGAPRINFLQWSEQCDQGYMMITPRGSMVSHPAPTILDGRGNLIWTDDRFGQVTDLKVQHFKGRDYLTFWAGWNGADHSYGMGIYYMLDSSYDIFKTIQPAGTLKGDLHEFRLTDEGTALMTIYSPEPANLKRFGGPSEGWILESSFQEIDIETGELLFEWRASDHHSFHESRRPFVGGDSPQTAFDWFHINSIDKDKEGNYYISARYTHGISCVSPSGHVLWNLGGRQNSFLDLSNGAATDFMWQHHARLHENSTMTIFDNAKSEKTKERVGHSRGMLLSLDLEQMTVTLVQEYSNPHRLLSQSQGSIQIIPETGNIVVGWGFLPVYTEFSVEGQVLCDARFGPPAMISGTGMVTSYRAFKSMSWIGRPGSPPDIYFKPSDGRLYVSWNGATEVDVWILQAADYQGVADGEWSDIETVKKESFETSILIGKDLPTYIRVSAIDVKDRTLGYTEVVNRRIGNAPSQLRQYVMVSLISMACIFISVWVFRKKLRSWLTYRVNRWRVRIGTNERDYKTAPEHELRPLYTD